MPNNEIPEPIVKWLELTDVLLGELKGWAAGDAEHERPGTDEDMARIMVATAALQAAAQVAQVARQQVMSQRQQHEQQALMRAQMEQQRR